MECDFLIDVGEMSFALCFDVWLSFSRSLHVITRLTTEKGVGRDFWGREVKGEKTRRKQEQTIR